MALRKLATIFQWSIQQQQQPIAEPGEPDSAPPQRPRTCSQNKALANVAIRNIYTATETYPQLVFFTLKKIKGFRTLNKKSTIAGKN